jgi:hypothetical protein
MVVSGLTSIQATNLTVRTIKKTKQCDSGAAPGVLPTFQKLLSANEPTRQPFNRQLIPFITFSRLHFTRFGPCKAAMGKSYSQFND